MWATITTRLENWSIESLSKLEHVNDLLEGVSTRTSLHTLASSLASLKAREKEFQLVNRQLAGVEHTPYAMV